MTWPGMSARLLLIAVVLFGYTAAASAITADEFRLRSGADYVALCSTPPSDPLYTAAIHMCHGFGAGTYQTIMAMARHEKVAPVICPSDPQPTRNEAIARFLEWAKQNPQRLTEPAVEVIARFLMTTYPCPAK